ncbi:hypothetical protein EPIB1_858 [Tritonibacter mobilis]|nr:hypothetical protein EPIB1_858 [Tritonibacter mobilis]
MPSFKSGVFQQHQPKVEDAASCANDRFRDHSAIAASPSVRVPTYPGLRFFASYSAIW